MRNWSEYRVKQEKHEVDAKLEEIPPNELDNLCRTVFRAMKRIFENPDIQKDYEIWKAEREKRRATQ